MVGSRLSGFGLLLLVGAALSGGCMGQDGPELGTVVGRVTIDGKPAQQVRVVFSLGHSRPSAAVTDSDGRYELLYTVNRKGALPGAHTVQFFQIDEMEEGGATPLHSGSAEIVREVKPGKNVFDFEL